MKARSPAPELPDPTGRRPWYRVSVRRALGLVFAAACVLALGRTLGQAVWETREAARRSQCVCNFCQITLTLHNYHDAYGRFPPAHVDDARGNRLHSWRVLLLPFMEQAALYNAYNFAEPWDSPGNLALLPGMPTGFACPSRPDVLAGPTGLTSYVAVTGPGTAFPDGGGVTFADIKDGTASTIFAVEVSGVDIPWTSPYDLDVRTMSFRVNDPRRAGVSSPHPGGANVAFADGATKFLSEKVSPRDLRAMLTINGGEAVDVERAVSGK